MENFIKFHSKGKICFVKKNFIVAIVPNDNGTDIIFGDDLWLLNPAEIIRVDENLEKILKMVHPDMKDFIELHCKGKLCLIKKIFIAGIIPIISGSSIIMGDDLWLLNPAETIYVDETTENIWEMLNPKGDS